MARKIAICLFPGDHKIGHATDHKFPVSFGSREWEELTEAEIEARFDAGAESFTAGSQWWYWQDFVEEAG